MYFSATASYLERRLRAYVVKNEGKAKVALVKCGSYSREEVPHAVYSAIGLLGGAGAFIRQGERTLVKPNMLSPYEPSHAVTTHPEIVGAVIDLVREVGAEVVVGDSPGHGGVIAVAKECGIASVCDEMGVPLVSFDDEVEVKQPSGRVCKEFTLVRPVLEAGAIISVAKMKTHALMTYTGAVKNLFGCIPGLKKMRMHLRYPDPNMFSQMLLDLLTLIKPRLSLLDAVIAMDGNGPSRGRVRPVGAIIASEDPIALDVVALRLVGADPMRVPYLRAARDLGVGRTQLEDIEVVGGSLEDFSIDDFRMPSAALANLGATRWLETARKHVTARPALKGSKCLGCGVCAESCPPQAISITPSRRARIDDRACIRCFCCYEMCPEGAVSLSQGLLAKFIDRVFESLERRKARQEARQR